MVPLDPDPFGEGRERRARTFARARIFNTATATGASRVQRLGPRAGTWAAHSRLFKPAANLIVVVFDFAATLTRPARYSIATLKESKTAQYVWLAIVLAIFVGSIVYTLVTGEGSGPG